MVASAALAGHTLTGAALEAPRRIAQRPQVRVIVDNDLAGDPDGLFALAHQWLSPSARTVLVTTSALNARLAAMAGEPAGRTAAKGRDLAVQLARLTGLSDVCPVVAGAESFGTGEAQVSPAAQAIVAEAQRDDPLPLVLACGGPLTNVAAALRLAPAIATHMSVVWIGGSTTPDAEPEYNLATDAAAAQQVLAHTGLSLRVVPRETYRQIRVSVAELTSDVQALSALGRWLVERYLNLPPFVQLGPTVTLGDSALVALAVLDRNAPTRRVQAAVLLAGADPTGQSCLLCEHIDKRTLLADCMAQLRLQARG